jgi:hypothetical protein
LDSINTKTVDMISSDNQPKWATTSDEDFTEAHYRQLLRAARASYRIATYDAIPWGTSFILWRHDLDFSINRAAALAAIEAEEGITATYFVNPHSEYYNPFEPGQAQLIKHILGLGHRLGLHFDAAPHETCVEEQLHMKVAQEARWLEEAFGVRPVVFSFHNPGRAHLQCDEDIYGGLINSYSRRLKSEIPYCSDSNGYWRFQRLHDVLIEAKEPCLQVLTHPGWWHDKPMPPRQRIFRSAKGRFVATMRRYDQGLEEHGRLNHAGPSSALWVLKDSRQRQYELCDFLWNQGHLDVLFVELWRLHEAQINRLSKAQLRKEWSIPASEVNAFFAADGVAVDGLRLFQVLFETRWQDATDISEQIHKDWVKVRNQLIHGKSSLAAAELEQGCIYLCEVMSKLATWGLNQSFKYDGLAHLGSIGLPTSKTAEGNLKENLGDRLDALSKYRLNRWQEFLRKLASLIEK